MHYCIKFGRSKSDGVKVHRDPKKLTP